MSTFNLHILKKNIESAIEEYLESKSIVIENNQITLGDFLFEEADTDFTSHSMAEQIAQNIHKTIIKNSMYRYNPPILGGYCNTCGGTRNGYWYSSADGSMILEEDLKSKSVIISD